ncbi:MAG TPA: outer membrane beta-barrel protein [Verrucomicrobiae bacterium]|nr:outer membrane beta-barrel protein [Verrucomicrobiae bacterium]
MNYFRLVPAIRIAVALAATCSGTLTFQVPAQTVLSSSADRDAEIQQLRELVLKLQARVERLEGQQSTSDTSRPPAGVPDASAAVAPVQSAFAATADDRGVLDFFKTTTMAIAVDGYYQYNFNDPIGRVNLLRAYDVSSNAFSLNQANLIIKRDPDVAAGRRFGVRLDLQFGQATETLQGNPANEPRPDVYRPIYQVYGTYVVPVGNGLTVDFGKWASSLGIEGNYTKDQMNYSRSYWFSFLPFYHMGARASYKLNDRVAVNYWVINGTQWTEAFNGFKDQMFGFNLQPHKTVNWIANYYLGQEHPDVVFFPNGGAPAGSPTEQGLPFQPVPNPANGRLHILDSYVTWQSTPKLTLALEGDYVIQRILKESAPSHATGGALYARYQAAPKVAFAARAEYLSDRGGIFSGTTQALKEATLTYDHKLTEGFLVRTEWRRDFSNRPFFLTDSLGTLSNHQNTATIGLVWWWGNHMGETW